MKYRSVNFMGALALATFVMGVYANDYDEISWLDLLPEQEKQALLNQGPIDHGENDIAIREPILGGSRSSAFAEKDYANAWQSANIRAEFAGRSVSLPGFIVPLEYDNTQRVTEFFLVPYFGACIHVPAPPPNQIIFVTIAKGLDLESIYEPYVVAGEMLITMTANELGISAYSINAENIEPYKK